MKGIKRRLLLIGGVWILVPWTAGIAMEISKNRARRGAEGADDAGDHAAGDDQAEDDETADGQAEDDQAEDDEAASA
ncbi:hypothetical protein [Patulibacter sp.]|uniref:hypothetical protein n=1 Tax=Patulibacter sp. TaxID=1912859 RepID=UPI00271B573A|nr:hypothetical protein [Patulibacter sp.]MDO9407977.1 hypothetical protein [Patulibacter sp.]